MLDRMTVAAVARELGLSWDTVSTIAIDATQTIVAPTVAVVTPRTVTTPDNSSANDTPTPRRPVVIHHGRCSGDPR